MDPLDRHELFEIDVLEALKNEGFLQRVVFGGGTMLRLCHDMPRYSTDLDFWLLRTRGWQAYHRQLRAFLDARYDLTDCHEKFFTLLYEVRAQGYPRRLKLEIRRKAHRGWEMEQKIAFSKHATRQVLVTGLTLPQMARHKVAALLDRREIRDAFDLEFLVRRGTPLPATPLQRRQIERILQRFKPREFHVTLGSLLEPKLRAYYRGQGFAFLLQHLRGVQH